MSLQIIDRRKSGNAAIAIPGALILMAISAGIIMAGSGSYKSTKHGDPQIGVFRDPNLARGNCDQCHLQHDGDQPNDFGLFMPSGDNNLCQSSGCHEFEYQWPAGDYYWPYPGNVSSWYNSGHGASASFFPPGSTQEVRLCVQCHDPHGNADTTNGVYPSATKFIEERGCYSNGGSNGIGCHGLSDADRPFGAADIYSFTLKASKHDYEMATKKHSGDWLSSYPFGREPRTVNSGFFSGVNRHIECVDCHNPHKAIPGAHQAGGNTIGGPLLGAWGVQPTNGGAWTIPTTYVSVDFNSVSSSYEYQLCFKCHSYFAYGDTPPTGYTDTAREFNPANLSYHPVEDYIPQNSYTSPSSVNNFIETMEPPWDNGVHDLMTCSDCHQSDVDTDPKGPHGSNQPYILTGSPAASDVDFCTKCHKRSVYVPAIQPQQGMDTGSRFDRQTTGTTDASHWYHVVRLGYGCRQCHGGRVNPPPSSPEQRSPYPIEVGTAHGGNNFPGLISGTNIYQYTPGSCWPTCHGRETFNAGPE